MLFESCASKTTLLSFAPPASASADPSSVDMAVSEKAPVWPVISTLDEVLAPLNAISPLIFGRLALMVLPAPLDAVHRAYPADNRSHDPPNKEPGLTELIVRYIEPTGYIVPIIAFLDAISDQLHYSSNEIACGTWTNGKTIYRKTFLNLPEGVSSHGISGISNIIKIEAVGKNGGNFYSIPYYYNETMYALIYANTSDIHIEKYGSLVGDPTNVTLYYTK